MPNVLFLDFEILDMYSLSMYNNGISLIDEIIVRNDCEYNLKNLEVEVSSSPSFFSVFSKKIADVASERCVVLSGCEPDFDVTKLMYASKITPTVVTVKVKNSGETLASVSKNVTLLPYDHIPPISVYTETIASFVTPHQQEIEELTLTVEECLRGQGVVSVNRDAWDLTSKRDTEVIIKAIYDSIKSLRITINTASAFSDTSPYKIKTAENLLQYRNGSSFELSLLFCSLAESLGLNSFIALTADSSVVGIFYGAEHFATCVSDDKRDLLQLHNGKCESFCIIDTTSVVNGINVSFDDSRLSAQRIIDKCANPIVIDIKSSRLSGYYPLPNRIYQNGDIIFETLGKEKCNTSSFDISIHDSSRFAEYVKSKLLSESSREKLLSIDASRCIFLIGGSHFILGKLVINGSIHVRALPMNDVLTDSKDIFNQLSVLNSGINTSDMSGTVNSIHSSDSFNRRILSILEDSDRNASDICLSLGSFNYFQNGRKVCSPWIFATLSVDVSTDQGISIKLNEQKISVNTAVTEVLSTKGVDTSWIASDSISLDSFAELSDKMLKAIEETDIEYFDTVAIITLNADAQRLYEASTPKYFEGSGILRKIFSGERLDPLNDSDEDIHLPLSLDSSQMNAVKAVQNNQCTVIRGVNGSGKTLTSAAIAFSELSHGRSVLYLSDEVHNVKDFKSYADKFGIGSRIAEIDSSSKLDSEADISDIIQDNESSESDNGLIGLISEQNEYYDALHKVNDIGFSLYEAISQYERYRSFPYSVSFSNDEISVLSKDDVVLWLDCVSSLAKAGADCKEPFSNPLALIKEKNFTYDFKSKAIILLNTHSNLTKSFLALQTQVTEYLGLNISILKEKQTTSLIKLLKCIKNESELIHYGIFGRDSVESDFSRIEALTLKCDDLFELKRFLEANFVSDVISLDFDVLLNEWRNALSKFALSRNASLNSVKNKLRAYCYDGKFLTNDNFVDVVSRLSRYKNSMNEAIGSSALIYQLTGIDIKNALDNDDDGVFLNMKDIIKASGKYISLLTEIYDGEKVSKDIYSHQANMFRQKARLVEDVCALIKDLELHYNSYTESETQLSELLKIDITAIKDENNKIWYYYVTQLLQRMTDSIDLLKYWCNWNVEREKAISLGLEKVVTLYENEQLSSTDIKNAFLKGFFKSVTEYFLSTEAAVSHFSSDSQEEKLEKINALLADHRKGLCATINKKCDEKFRKLCSELSISEENAVTITRNCFSHSDNNLSVELLQALKPCFVCKSPAFLTRMNNPPMFDTVIADITSNEHNADIFMLFPIARKVVIIDDINYRKTSSLSDNMVSCGAASIQLNCVYSSNYGSHIINELLYNNTLSVFPFSGRGKKGISVIKQAGTFDSKNTRVNMVEASAAVDEIIKLKQESPDARIGVYAVTEQQSALIKLLYKKRSLIGADVENDGSISILSLKDVGCGSVDYVILSTVISIDEKTKYNDRITKAIPELNDDGIDALKNILLSAKKELTVITSLSQKELTEYKTTEIGYVFFKKLMLRFLNEGDESTRACVSTSTNDNPILREVSNHIESLGYKAEFNIGTNKCKVDIAIRRKTDSKYLLGILFDESVYINNDDFISRDLMIKGLESIGNWKILRIYTIDWFENYSKQLDMITSALNGDNFDGIFFERGE